MKLTAAKLCELFEVDRRTVTNWLNEDPPVPSTVKKRVRYFEAASVIAWFVARSVKQARGTWDREKPADKDEVAEAKKRRIIDEARLVALEVDEAEGKLIPIDIHEQRVKALCEPLAAGVKTLSKYIGDVQAATSDVDAAVLLDRIGDDLLRTMRGTADDIEEAEDDDGTDEAAA